MSEARSPTAVDFPSDITLTIINPPPTQRPVNVLILLHGLGDVAQPFANLARQMSLPETVCLSIQAPSPLPFDLRGFHWGDDIVFDQSHDGLDVDTGFEKSHKLLSDGVIKEVLIGKCGYSARDIMLFGFGQGGIAALKVAATLVDDELAGVISVGGPVPATVQQKTSKSKPKTPVLLLGGSSRSLLTVTAIRNAKDVFEYVQVTTWQRPGDGMPSNRAEMLPIMAFLARRLRSRVGVLRGAVELS